jgi:hypothetical protein
MHRGSIQVDGQHPVTADPAMPIAKRDRLLARKPHPAKRFRLHDQEVVPETFVLIKRQQHRHPVVEPPTQNSKAPAVTPTPTLTLTPTLTPTLALTLTLTLALALALTLALTLTLALALALTLALALAASPGINPFKKGTVPFLCRGWAALADWVRRRQLSSAPGGP